MSEDIDITDLLELLIETSRQDSARAILRTAIRDIERLRQKIAELEGELAELQQAQQ